MVKTAPLNNATTPVTAHNDVTGSTLAYPRYFRIGVIAREIFRDCDKWAILLIYIALDHLIPVDDDFLPAI
jgi:hypothetical protein